MPTTRCPKCNLPLTQQESQGASCPECKCVFALAGQPSALDQEAGDGGLGLALALVGALAGAFIGLALFGPGTWGTSICAGAGFAAARLLALLIPRSRDVQEQGDRDANGLDWELGIKPGVQLMRDAHKGVVGRITDRGDGTWGRMVRGRDLGGVSHSEAEAKRDVEIAWNLEKMESG
jgi:hypothetical protein